jgi:hypothetical protein
MRLDWNLETLNKACYLMAQAEIADTYLSTDLDPESEIEELSAYYLSAILNYYTEAMKHGH